MLLNQGSQKAFNFTDSNLKRNSRALLKHNLNTEVKHLASRVRSHFQPERRTIYTFRRGWGLGGHTEFLKISGTPSVYINHKHN